MGWWFRVGETCYIDFLILHIITQLVDLPVPLEPRESTCYPPIPFDNQMIYCRQYRPQLESNDRLLKDFRSSQLHVDYDEYCQAEALHSKCRSAGRWGKACHEENLIISAEEYARLQGQKPGATDEMATAEQGK